MTVGYGIVARKLPESIMASDKSTIPSQFMSALGFQFESPGCERKAPLRIMASEMSTVLSPLM
jgi:hypothetical protein